MIVTEPHPPQLQNLTYSYVPPFDEFPPLVKGRTLKIRDKFEAGVPHHGEGSSGPRNNPTDQAPRVTSSIIGPIPTKIGANAGPASLTLAGGAEKGPSSVTLPRAKEDSIIKNSGTLGSGSLEKSGAGPSSGSTWSKLAGGAGGAGNNTNKPRTMADILRERPEPSGPQVFEPEKIQRIGHATLSNGIPAIYFSGAEIQKLAENVGYAIVGKFSHSIPASHQIQKALDNIKFARSFTWKYINAKHILVQFEDMADYARMLNGPKGTPVWFIDRHPMRVFKWTPDFDAYCESPIAAIWCNLIGLPIHLFDHSALFAIGKLLGNPIQVDQDTANKKRLSFARICVEIDITKPPPEEIILDICGRETVQPS